jgi:hypothetical protein
MKRLHRALAVIGGLAGIAWAMRDRLISIDATREEKPPTFRVVGSDGRFESSPPR